MIERLTTKRGALTLVMASASLILLSGSREWVSGSVGDAVLGSSVLHGRGSQIAPGALAAALVGLTAAVVAATSGPVVRVVAACAAVLAAVLGLVVVIGVLADPGGALGRLAASGTGRSGTLAADGRAGSWAWVALVAMIAMAAGGLGALVGGRRWRGLSGRYDAPVVSVPVVSRESAWDQLSRGEDPTTERPAGN